MIPEVRATERNPKAGRLRGYAISMRRNRAMATSRRMATASGPYSLVSTRSHEPSGVPKVIGRHTSKGW